MKTSLIASRDAFARLHPEARLTVNTREWGILRAGKSGPVLPAQSLSQSRVFIIESGDDHLIPAPIRAELRAALPATRCFHFKQGSHFPYVTRRAEYTAILEDVLGLAPAHKETEVTL